LVSRVPNVSHQGKVLASSAHGLVVAREGGKDSAADPDYIDVTACWRPTKRAIQGGCRRNANYQDNLHSRFENASTSGRPKTTTAQWALVKAGGRLEGFVPCATSDPYAQDATCGYG
jgi:hypothetical protein